MRRFAGNKSSIRDFSSGFEMSESTLHRCMSRLQDFLVQIAPSVIKPSVTTDEQKEQIAASFETVRNIEMRFNLLCDK